MRIPRIYTDQPLAADARVELEEAASHHLLKVLRMQPGRELIVFNGKGGEYPATIDSTGKKTAVLLLGEHQSRECESPLAIELAIGVSRGDRFDWVLQKATELGVSRITPLFTERTEVKLSGDRLQKRWQQWQKIVIGACEQCQRNRLPALQPVTSLTDYLPQCDANLRFVLHHRAEASLQRETPPPSVALLIGPEGGLSDDEIRAAEASGFVSWALGPRVFRTETAPIAALAVLQTLWGDFLPRQAV